jgi:hypothetical protein
MFAVIPDLGLVNLNTIPHPDITDVTALRIFSVGGELRSVTLPAKLRVLEIKCMQGIPQDGLLHGVTIPETVEELDVQNDALELRGKEDFTFLGRALVKARFNRVRYETVRSVCLSSPSTLAAPT